MKERLITFSDTVIKYGLLSVAFLTPIFFLPVTTEFYQLNKLVYLIFITLVMTVFWTVKMLAENKVRITKTPVHLPIFLVIIAMLVATIFSQTPVNSLFGNYGRFQPNLTSYIVYALFFYLMSTNLRSKADVKRILEAWVFGVAIAAIFGIFGYFGVFAGVSGLPIWMAIRNFTTVGSPNILSLITALSLPLSLVLVRSNTSYLVITGLFYLSTIFLGGFSQIFILVLSLIVMFFLVPKGSFNVSKYTLPSFVGVLLVVTLLNFVPATKNILRMGVDYPRGIQLDAGTSWVVSTRVLSDSIRTALTGTGPGTFLSDFTRFKPLSFNGTDFWNVRFDLPASEYLLYLAATGLLGLMAYGYLAYRGVKASFAAQKGSVSMFYSASFATVVFASFVSQLFFTTSISTQVLLFISLAGLFVLEKLSDKAYSQSEDVVISLAALREKLGLKRQSGQFEVLPVIFLTTSLLITGVAFYYFGRGYQADYFFRKSLVTNISEGNEIYTLQRKAITLNPYFDNYRRQYARTNMALANAIAQKADPTDQDRADIQQLISQAIREVRVVTERLDPFNPFNWETRAAIYGGLTGVAQNADRWAIDSYNNAILLDPTNPNLRIGIGGIYYAIGDFTRASAHFADAVRLKNDLANAHYNLAAALRQDNNFQSAVTEMEIVLRLVAKDSADYDRASKDLETLKTLLAQSGEERLGPSVEQLESEPSEQQEGLTEPGAEESGIQEGVIDLTEEVEATPSITPTEEE